MYGSKVEALSPSVTQEHIPISSLVYQDVKDQSMTN